MSIPRWLGKVYSRLYAEFGSKEFTFEEALQKLGGSDRELRVFLSNLRRSGFLDVFARKGRKRIYRLADPSEVTFLLGKGIDVLRVHEEARPVLRTYLAELFERYRDRVVSIVLYGSFSVGKYHRESDIDLLLVIEGYRWEETLRFDRSGRLAFRQWQLDRRHHTVLPYPLTTEQARYHRPIYLDMVEDGMILYDKGGFIGKVFDEIRKRLAELGAKRHRLPSGGQYWVFKPDMKFGEVVEA